MKAAVYTEYGPPDVVEIKDLEKPVPSDDEVLIAIRAASVNALDMHAVSGTPFLVRMMFGLRRPKDSRLGVDVAGVVEAVGKNITEFKPGDAVFGNCRGAFAEYRCAPASALVMKPEGVTFEQAASLPVAGFTAMQALRKGGIRSGQTVLVNGAGGGVGSFAVQIAKSFGARVTGVTSARNADFVRAIGADQIIDYTREDFAQLGHRYDLILDCYATRSLLTCRRLLNPNGAYVVIGGPMGRAIDPLLLAIKCPVLSWFGSRKLHVLFARRSKDDLATLIGLVKDGKIAPAIDRRYRLSEIRDALRHLMEGNVRGKISVTMDPDDGPDAHMTASRV
jgi:NADPH:quinone reductase-like Zn-dependent oxidoreductase